MKSFILFIILLVLSLNSVPSWSAPTCQSLFEPGGLSHVIAPESKKSKEAKLVRTTYESSILNQGRRGFCWLYATFGNLVMRALRRTGKDPGLSIYYPSYYHWLIQATKAALDPTATEVAEGGSFNLALNFFTNFGMITNEKWASMGGATDIELPVKDALESPQIKALVQKSHIGKSLLTNWLKPDLSIQSSKEAFAEYYQKLYQQKAIMNSLAQLLDEKTNRLRNAKPTHYTPSMIEELRKISTKGLIPQDELTGHQIQAILDANDADITADMKRLFNQIYFKSDESPLDKEVNIEEAKKLAYESFPELATPHYTLMVSPDRKQAPQAEKDSLGHMNLLVSTKDAAKILRSLIESNTVVTLTYDHQAHFVDAVDTADPENQGMMSLKRVNDAPIKTYLSRLARKIKSAFYERGGHLVDVVGVYILPNATDEQKATGADIDSFLIHNSWGETYGQKGMFRMDISYFGAYGEALNGFLGDLNTPTIRAILGDEVTNTLFPPMPPMNQ